MGYIGKHWRGDLSLPVSFWVNGFCINIIFILIFTGLTTVMPEQNPVTAARIFILMLATNILIVYPWQVVGLWRSACNYAEEKKTKTWPAIVKALVVLGLLGTLGRMNTEWPLYTDMYELGFKKDEWSEYSITLATNKELIHLKGKMGFGLSKDVAKFIKKHPDVKGIILDSIGGRIYEGRELSKLILVNSFNTYTLNGCYSACATAFISGNKRYLAKGANIGFHQYVNTLKSVDDLVDMPAEEQKDLDLYRKRGITESFITRIFKAKPDELWYPTIDEMLDAGVIHGLVNSSDLSPIKYATFKREDVVRVFLEFSAYKPMKKYDPHTFDEMIDSVVNELQKGSSIVEVQQDASKRIEKIAFNRLYKTSDKVIIDFARQMTYILNKLESKDPFVCLKYIFPERFGALDVTKYISKQDLGKLSDLLGLIVEDSYQTVSPPINEEKALHMLTEITGKIGENIQYINDKELNNSEDYSKACRATIDFYKYFLGYDRKEAANGLRYIFKI